MSHAERVMADAISPAKVRYLPGTFHKRFAGEMAALADDADAELTPKQADLLRDMVRRYRRQIPEDVIALAGAQ